MYRDPVSRRSWSSTSSTSRSELDEVLVDGVDVLGLELDESGDEAFDGVDEAGSDDEVVARLSLR